MDAADPSQDDAYRDLFRPEPEAEQPDVPETQLEPEFAPVSDTGRLFRSRGAEPVPQALVAVSPHEAAHLRTLTGTGSATSATEVPPEPVIADAFAAPVVNAAPVVTMEEEPTMARASRSAPGIKPIGVYLLVIGTALVAGFLDSFIGGAGLGWLTGIAVAVVSIFCALRVRSIDASVAVIAPPIAYGIAALTVGQLGESRAGGLVISGAVNGFFALADNWFWIIGITLACLAIVVVRARR